MTGTVLPDIRPIKEAKLNQIALSFDLETPNTFGAGIFSIGIVPFDFITKRVFRECAFYARIDFAEVLDMSQNTGETMKWWMQQTDAARKELVCQEISKVEGRTVKKDLPCCEYEEALLHSLSFIMQVKSALLTNGKLQVMGNGSIFDIGKFEDTLRQFNIVGYRGSQYKLEEFQRLCYAFWDIIDLRSYVHAARLVTGKDPKKLIEREGTHHNAADDAAYQAELAIKSIELLEENHNAGNKTPDAESGD